MKLPPVQGESSLDLPDIAVSNGKVFIPDMYFYVLVHGTTSEEQQNYMWYYVAARAVVVIAVVVSVNIMKRNKK